MRRKKVATAETRQHAPSPTNVLKPTWPVWPLYNRNMCFYIAPIIKLLKMVTLCSMSMLNLDALFTYLMLLFGFLYGLWIPSVERVTSRKLTVWPLWYNNNLQTMSRRTKKRRRRVVWYNLPYSKNVTANIGKEFFKILQLHFPKQHPLHTIFNKNTVKLSYSCTTNMDNIVKAHNAKISLKEDKKDEEEKGCNCRDKAACPVANKCLKTNVVYKATVQYDDKTQHYIWMTENTFKTRYTLHKSSLRHSKNRNQTELSNLIWSLTDKGTDYKLTWKIIDQARPYQPGKRTCNLCLSEKFHILVGSHLINRKTELLNKCPHRRKFLARNHKPC